MVVIKGVGWIIKDKYGCLKQGLQRSYENREMLHSRLQKKLFTPLEKAHPVRKYFSNGVKERSSLTGFTYPVKNFGRFDEVSKMTCYSVALSLRDAGAAYSRDYKQDIGIIGTNSSGCLQSNLNYFKDYVESGRKLARGSLFIYTLPSSSIAEAAIHFGFQGPLLYMASSNHAFSDLLRTAGEMITLKEAVKMVVVKADKREAICFLLEFKENNSVNSDYDLNEISKTLEKLFSVEEIINKIGKVKK